MMILARQKNGLASIKRHVSAKFPTANGLIIIVKIMLMTMMKIIMIITIEKGEAYHLVPKSILSYFIGEYKGNLEGEHCLGFSSIF